MNKIEFTVKGVKYIYEGNDWKYQKRSIEHMVSMGLEIGGDLLENYDCDYKWYPKEVEK